MVYAKPPFAGPQAVLAYLARYTHRVAISNRRLVAMDERGVTFRYKDYRQDGAARYQTMTLAPAEFIRRFLLHVLPKGFHRLRHYGLLASASRKANLARIRDLLAVPQPITVQAPAGEPAPEPWRCCPCCGGPMVILEILTGHLVSLPPYRGTNAVNVAHHAKTPLAAGAVWAKTRTVAEQIQRPGTAIRHHPRATAFTENLKSPEPPPLDRRFVLRGLSYACGARNSPRKRTPGAERAGRS